MDKYNSRNTENNQTLYREVQIQSSGREVYPCPGRIYNLVGKSCQNNGSPVRCMQKACAGLTDGLEVQNDCSQCNMQLWLLRDTDCEGVRDFMAALGFSWELHVPPINFLSPQCSIMASVLLDLEDRFKGSSFIWSTLAL